MYYYFLYETYQMFLNYLNSIFVVLQFYLEKEENIHEKIEKLWFTGIHYNTF